MSLVVTPDSVAGAASDLAGIRAALSAAADSITGATTKIAPAAADEVSRAIAALFGGLGDEFQAVRSQTQAFHAEIIRTLDSSVRAYVNAEAAIAEQLSAGAGPAAAALPAASILDGLLNPGALVGGPGGLLGGLGVFNPGVACSR